MKKHSKAIRVSVLMFFTSMICVFVAYRCSPNYFHEAGKNSEYAVDTLYIKDLDTSSVVLKKYNQVVNKARAAMWSTKSAQVFETDSTTFFIGKDTYYVKEKGMLVRYSEVKKK